MHKYSDWLKNITTKINKLISNDKLTISNKIEPSKMSIKQIYQERDYLEAYSQHTDYRVLEDPKSAVGGMWEEIGKLQYNFLIGQGLLPTHTILDIGCGTLRGGRYFIRYLQPNKYTGIDISPAALNYAEKLVTEENLSEKKPRLLLNKDKKLKFKEFSNETFDYIIAQSVFTHLRPEDITECFEYISNIMTKESLFYFTYWESSKIEQVGLKDFTYSFQFFQNLAEKYGYLVRDCSDTYNHPRGQKMLEVKLK